MRIRKSEWGRMIKKQAGRALAVLAAAVFLVWCDPIVSRAEATGKVLAKTVHIRKQPDQSSDPIGSSSAGKEISIKGKVEVSGITWYQVYIDANTLGYVRADMIETGEGDIPTVSATADTSDTDAGADSSQTDTADTAVPTGSGTGAQVQAQEEMAFQYATTKVTSKVRPDPSTSNNPVESLAEGTQVVVSGKSEGTDGKTWYFVNFTGANGSEKTGYIRSDLLDLGDLLPVEETTEPEPDVEPEEPEPAPRNDYELKIETNSEGEEIWYLYDINGDKKEVKLLWESAGSQSVDDKKDTDAIVKQRIVIVVLAVLLAVFAVTVIIMAFKLRDAYYEDYEDDEDEEEEQAPVRRSAERERQQRRRTSAEEEAKPVRRRENAEPPRKERPERAKREREVTYREEPEAEAVRTAPKRKTKNFLLDDDEFEFEFLNMDDKDLKK